LVAGRCDVAVTTQPEAAVTVFDLPVLIFRKGLMITSAIKHFHVQTDVACVERHKLFFAQKDYIT